jgi:hypothetical protein
VTDERIKAHLSRIYDAINECADAIEEIGGSLVDAPEVPRVRAMIDSIRNAVHEGHVAAGTEGWRAD